jgi:hypothetical protein
MGRAPSLSVVMRLIAQISKSDAHVMMQSIRHCDGHAKTKNAVRQPKRV